MPNLAYTSCFYLPRNRTQQGSPFSLVRSHALQLSYKIAFVADLLRSRLAGTEKNEAKINKMAVSGC